MPGMASPALSEILLGRNPTRPSTGRGPAQGPHPAGQPYEQGGLRRVVALGLAIVIQLIAAAVLFSHVGPPPRPGEHIVDLKLVEMPEKPPDPPPPMPAVHLPPAPLVVLPAPPAL